MSTKTAYTEGRAPPPRGAAFGEWSGARIRSPQATSPPSVTSPLTRRRLSPVREPSRRWKSTGSPCLRSRRGALPGHPVSRRSRGEDGRSRQGIIRPWTTWLPRDALEGEIDRFATVLADGAMNTAVPTCPGWNVADLSFTLAPFTAGPSTSYGCFTPVRVPSDAMGLSTGPLTSSGFAREAPRSSRPFGRLTRPLPCGHGEPTSTWPSGPADSCTRRWSTALTSSRHAAWSRPPQLPSRLTPSTSSW